MSSNETKDETLDLLHGYEAIGAFVGKSERAAEWWVKKHNVPVRRMGRTVVASKSVLRRLLVPQDGETA